MAAAEGERRDRARGVVTDPRQRDQVVVRRRHLAVVPLHDRLGRGMQSQRATRVAEPTPGADRLAAGCVGQRVRASARWSSSSRRPGSTRATGVCWSMNSETITAHGVAPGPRQGRSRAWSSYHRRIGACRSLMSAPSVPAGRRMSNQNGPFGAVRQPEALSALHHRSAAAAHYRGAHGLGAGIRVVGCPGASTGSAAVSCSGWRCCWSSGSASCSAATGEDPGCLRTSRRAPPRPSRSSRPRRPRSVRWPRRRRRSAKGKAAAAARRAVSARTTR